MPVVSAKNARGDERTKFCRLLGNMLKEDNSVETKRRLSLEFTEMVKGFKSFQEIGAKYLIDVREDVEDDFLHVKMVVPQEFIPNGHTGENYVDFVVNVESTKGYKAGEGVGPVLSKEEADKIYSKDENTFGVQ